MASSKLGKRGGRPRNSWNPSRRRKLARLYTLTRLDKNEIHAVLKTKSFAPSSRDIQNQLRSLFSADYAKEHRRYRPSNDNSIKFRFEQLHRCREFRVSKRRKNFLVDQPIISQKNLATRHFDKFDSPPTAFRHYEASLPKQSSKYEFQLSDSVLVTPSLLMLDGSSLERQKPGECPNNTETTTGSANETDSCLIKTCVEQSSNSENCSSIIDVPTRRSSLQSLRQRLAEKYPDETLSYIQSVLCYSSSNSKRSSLMSFASWISWKSNRSSFIIGQGSDAGSLMSIAGKGRLSHETTDSEPRDIKSRETEDRQNGTQMVKSWAPTKVLGSILGISLEQRESIKTISRWEGKIWKLIIRAEERQRQFLSHRPHHSISTLGRTCCLPFAFRQQKSQCKNCGLSPEHWRQICNHLSPEVKLPAQVDLNTCKDVDFYGNTILHCLAEAVGPDDLQVMRSLIRAHKDIIQQTNTCGSTFLHLVCRRGLNSTESANTYIEILKDLTVLDFDFSKRDYHGRNVAHCLMQNTKYFPLDNLFLGKVFSITKLDINAPDNSGFVYVTNMGQLKSQTSNVRCAAGEVSTPDSLPTNRVISEKTFRESLKSSIKEQKVDKWLCDLMRCEGLNQIDRNGDTLLAAVLKEWKSTDGGVRLTDTIKTMVDRGADIHIRDRYGNPPIAIAAMQGLRPVASFLLEAGANINSRSYERLGILSQVEQVLERARVADNDALYAQQLTCHNLLVDAGAKLKPSEKDEWMLPSARALLPKEEIKRPA